MLDLNDILVFARVVEGGSFTAAAHLLGMPKTTVSRRIAALEEEIGIRLLQRTTRSLSLTDAGRLYYERGSQALRTIEEANHQLAEAKAEPTGTIRISAPVGFGNHILNAIVFDFLALHPRTKVELQLTDEMINLVETGIDLAFRTGTLSDSTLIARKLGSNHRSLCASPDYLARHGVPKKPADLSRHQCLTAGLATSGILWVLDGPTGQETVTVSGRFAANEMQAVLAAAIAGLGIAQLPHKLMEAAIANGQLRLVLEDWTTPAGGVHVVYPSSQHLSPLVRAFIELAARRIGATDIFATTKNGSDSDHLSSRGRRGRGPSS